MTEKQTYILAGCCFLSAALLGAIYLTVRNAKPCPCAEHQPEAEAARVAQASAELKYEVTEPASEYLNGKTLDPEQAMEG
jgi:hypothetical protein